MEGVKCIRRWGENTTRPRSRGGRRLACDGHRTAHVIPEDDGENQTSASSAGRLLFLPFSLPTPSAFPTPTRARPFPPPPRCPPLPGRLALPTVDGGAAAFACRSASAALQLPASCNLRMNESVPSTTRPSHLPAF